MSSIINVNNITQPDDDVYVKILKLVAAHNQWAYTKSTLNVNEETVDCVYEIKGKEVTFQFEYDEFTVMEILIARTALRLAKELRAMYLTADKSRL